MENSAELAEQVERLSAQVTALSSIVGVLIASAPTARQRRRATARAVAQLENLTAVVLGDDGPHSEAVLHAVDELRAQLSPDS